METGDQRKFGYGGDGGGECPSRVPRSRLCVWHQTMFSSFRVETQSFLTLMRHFPTNSHVLQAGGGWSGDDGDGDDGWEPGGDGDSVRPMPPHSITCQPTIQQPTRPKQFPKHDTWGPLSAVNRRAPSLPPPASPAPPAASHGPVAQHGGAGDPGGGGGVGRGLHSSTLRLNVSAFCGIGGAFRGCFGGVWMCSGVLQGFQGVFCVRNGSS
jgi:hypothetical protein